MEKETQQLLKELKQYFGIHDKTSFEHRAYSIICEILKNEHTDLTNPTEIKEKLISEGWEEDELKYVCSKIGSFYIRFAENGSFQMANVNHFIKIENISYQRIKALIYGLTGNK